MININLLPLEKRKKGFPIYKLFLFGIYGILGITLLLWAFNLGMYKYDESKLKKVEDSLGKLTVWQQRYDLNTLQNADINRRGKLVADISKKRVLWSESLANLGNITPYGCWLTKVAQDNKAKENNIVLEGRALKMDYVLQLIHNLQQDPKNKSVALETSENKKMNEYTTITSFTIRISQGGGDSHAK